MLNFGTSSGEIVVIDKDYKLPEDINWAPDNFEPDFIHSFHLRGQLEHKYPAEEGGIKLYPKNWNKADTKYHGFLDAQIILMTTECLKNKIMINPNYLKDVYNIWQSLCR